MSGTNSPVDWVYCAAIGLGGGLIHNIVNPSQRGFAGFVSSAAVGTFCGFLGGVVAAECDASPGVQWLCSGAAGVFGFAVLQGVFSFLNNRKSGQNVNVYGGHTHVGHSYGGKPMSEGSTNINVSGQGCQQNINSTIHGQTQHNQFGDTTPSVERIYDVITNAIPESDQEARAAAKYLLEREANADPNQELDDEAKRSQSLLARYKGPILSALAEMGMTWLQAAYPQVILVKPLIKFALDSLTDNS